MKCCIIHYYYCFLRQLWDKMFFKPCLKKLRVHHSFVFKRSNNLFTNLSCNYIRPLEFFASNFTDDNFSLRRTRIFTVKKFIYSRFVDINYIFSRNVFYLLKIIFYFLSVLLIVACCLFFRVIFSL